MSRVSWTRIRKHSLGYKPITAQENKETSFARELWGAHVHTSDNMEYREHTHHWKQEKHTTENSLYWWNTPRIEQRKLVLTCPSCSNHVALRPRSALHQLMNYLLIAVAWFCCNSLSETMHNAQLRNYIAANKAFPRTKTLFINIVLEEFRPHKMTRTHEHADTASNCRRLAAHTFPEKFWCSFLQH